VRSFANSSSTLLDARSSAGFGGIGPAVLRGSLLPGDAHDVQPPGGDVDADQAIGWIMESSVTLDADR
jgi:hypothetical protein